jgi:hypothetical protein
VLEKGNEFLNALRSTTETLAAWRENHEADLHTANDILGRLQGVFGEVVQAETPYFFRYLANAIVPGTKRDSILQEFCAQETALISRGEIVGLGRRFVAEHRTKSK